MKNGQLNKKTIRLGEHVFIAGKTGTGKSVAAEVYLAGEDYVIKLDTKDEVSERRNKGQNLWRGLKENVDFVVVTSLIDIQHVDPKIKKIIYVPKFEEQNSDTYDRFFKFIYERENTAVWIDELMSVADSPSRYPPYLKALYTRGRSKNISVWALTQRPMDIPAICTANSTHFFIFNLRLDQDRKKVADVLGMPELLVSAQGYNFWYAKDDDVKPIMAVLKL